ncbi:TraK family protein [Paraburkholderia kururiensis]|uniref:TraK family protein n=1 Tax=Paraburkholderia kururiensis TaxID=984307 RepID=UPI000F87E907|nr:TraK family protein [Paraburkholderia kururiensis]
MSREKLLEALHGLERRETPGSAATQLREVREEITAMLGKGFTLRRVWTALHEDGGLTMTYSAFKSAYYRMQPEAVQPQGVSTGVTTCPHCGKALPVVAGRDSAPAGESSAEQPTLHGEGPASPPPAATSAAAASDSHAARESFAEIFLQRREFAAGRRWK